jgi:hypothetical protein
MKQTTTSAATTAATTKVLMTIRSLMAAHLTRAGAALYASGGDPRQKPSDQHRPRVRRSISLGLARSSGRTKKR